MTLKRLSCVSFAGVDSLDDVKNHTYNELFVSGGFVVSDESVLTPESITTGKCDAFETLKQDEKKANIFLYEMPYASQLESSLPSLCDFFGGGRGSRKENFS